MTPRGSKNFDTELQEVCYGHVKAQAQIHTVPTPSSPIRGGWGYWPTMTCDLVHRKELELAIRVYGPCGVKIGWVSGTLQAVLTGAMDTVDGLRLQAYLPRRPTIGGEHAGHACSEFIDLIINVYGPRREATSVGKMFGRIYCWIRPPMSPDAGVPICNPHANRFHTESQEWPEGSAPKHVDSWGASPQTGQNITQGATKDSEKAAMKHGPRKSVPNLLTDMIPSTDDIIEQPATPSSWAKRRRMDDTSEASQLRDDRVAKLSSEKVKLMFENGDLTKRLGDHVLETARVLLKNDKLSEKLNATTEEKAELGQWLDDMTQEKEKLSAQVDNLNRQKGDVEVLDARRSNQISELDKRNHEQEADIREKDERIDDLVEQNEKLRTKWKKVKALVGEEEDFLG